MALNKEAITKANDNMVKNMGTFLEDINSQVSSLYSPAYCTPVAIKYSIHSLNFYIAPPKYQRILDQVNVFVLVHLGVFPHTHSW